MAAPGNQKVHVVRHADDFVIEPNIVESISHESVRQVLKKHHQTLAEAHVVHPGTG